MFKFLSTNLCDTLHVGTERHRRQRHPTSANRGHVVVRTRGSAEACDVDFSGRLEQTRRQERFRVKAKMKQRGQRQTQFRRNLLPAARARLKWKTMRT